MAGSVKRKTVMRAFINKGEILPDNRSDFENMVRIVSDKDPDSENLVFEYGLKKLSDKLYGKELKNSTVKSAN